jgi:DNA-binding response OmpR family regulator
MEVLREIRKANDEIGVFILTGHGNMTLAIEALRSGADDFILKPYDPDELILQMNRFFEKQKALRKIKINEKLLPACMYCHKIRDDYGKKPGTGRWLEMQEYLCPKCGTSLTHGCCPECFDLHLKDVLKVKIK